MAAVNIGAVYIGVFTVYTFYPEIHQKVVSFIIFILFTNRVCINHGAKCISIINRKIFFYFVTFPVPPWVCNQGKYFMIIDY